MNSPEDLRKDDEIAIGELVRPLVLHRRQIWLGTLAATVLAVAVGALYAVVQPSTRSARLEFRPLFNGANEGKYPNDLPFSATDVVNPSVVDQVFARNALQQFCPPGTFLSGLVVEESSPALVFLDLDYRARLSDARLSAVDRQRLQEEYTSRRASLERQYQLTFIEPRECRSIPIPVLVKALPEILETWATDSEEKRGVMKLRIPMLTPAIFDQSASADESLLVRADLLRSAVERVIANIIEVEALPGSELVRGSEKNISLREVRAELEDLMQARLDPLVAQAGRGLGRESLRWIEQALQTSTIRLQAAQQRAEALRMALREYSGVPTVSPAGSTSAGNRPQASSDVQALTPQIDRTFIDRIVDLSSLNTTFRQEITRDAINASVEAVNRAAVVEQYRQLLQSMEGGTGESIPAERVSRTLEQIAAQAKDATQRFNEIYAEFSRVSLRAGPTMYRIERPPEVVVIRAFGLGAYASLILAVALATPLVLAIVFLARHHIRRLSGSLQ
jgi:hypothetical protein